MSRSKKDAKYKGTRILLKGSLGKIKLSVQIDFGFGDVVVPTPIEIKLPELLDFGKPDLIGYSVESVIAEKFQAIVELDLTNTRMKDFFDIWMLSKNIDFDEETLYNAIKETFKNRKTEIPTDIPNALTADFSQDEDKQKQWRAFLKKNKIDDEIELEEVNKEIKEFLMPVIEFRLII